MLGNKRPSFFRRSSTETIDLIQLNTYPALEKNPLLKEGILSVLNQLYYLDKINRIDAPQASTSHARSDSLVGIRKQLAEAMNDLLPELDSEYDEAERKQDIVTMQNIYSDTTIKIYENWKENNTEQYQQTGFPVHCGEACSLFYGLLRREGIDGHKMRIVCFQSAKVPNLNHSLIIYAENKALLQSIESLGLGEKNAAGDSYQNFLEILAQRNKEEAILLIDPWSQDNKIIDLEIKDRIYKDYFSELQENIRQKLWLQIVIGSLLIESTVTSVGNFSDVKQAFCYLPRPMESSSEEETTSCSTSSPETMQLK